METFIGLSNRPRGNIEAMLSCTPYHTGKQVHYVTQHPLGLGMCSRSVRPHLLWPHCDTVIPGRDPNVTITDPDAGLKQTQGAVAPDVNLLPQQSRGYPIRVRSSAA